MHRSASKPEKAIEFH
jgi:hypothetical protein